MNEAQRKKKQAKFLEVLAGQGVVSNACKSAGIGRTVVYLWRDQDESFKAAWDEALETSNDTVRSAIYTRAVEGYEKPVVSMGRLVRDEHGQVLTEKVYSDSLLQFIARSRMAEFTERKQIEHSGSIDVNSARETLLQKLGSMTPKQEAEDE